LKTATIQTATDMLYNKPSSEKFMARYLSKTIETTIALLCLAIGYLQPDISHANDGIQTRSGSLLIELNPETGAVEQLEDTDRGLSWHPEGSKLWQVDREGEQLHASLSVVANHADEVTLTLSLHNPTEKAIKTGVHFPRLEGVGGVDATSLHYCFPRQDLILGSKSIRLEETYSNRFPLQFVTAYQPAKGGLYLMTCDTEMHRKRYYLDKDTRLTMGAFFPDLVIESGETIELPPARLGVYAGDWHQAFDAYKRWTKQWYKPDVPRKQWFREIFHFRQVFLYPNMDMPGLFDTETKSLTITSSIENDRKRFGGIDYVHVFDWSQTPDQGRVGMYDPWHFLPRDKFNDQIGKLQAAGMPVGLYFEGYLVSPAATIPNRPGRSWQLQTPNAGRYDPFGSGDDYLCPAVQGWRDNLTASIKRAEKQTRADGFYIDQFGFGYQYPCFDETHGHAMPSNQPKAETEFVKQVRAALGDKAVLYTEQTPVDLAMRHQDGSFSYSLLHARNTHCPSRTNLTRFAFPNFKETLRSAMMLKVSNWCSTTVMGCGLPGQATTRSGSVPKCSIPFAKRKQCAISIWMPLLPMT